MKCNSCGKKITKAYLDWCNSCKKPIHRMYAKKEYDDEEIYPYCSYTDNLGEPICSKCYKELN